MSRGPVTEISISLRLTSGGSNSGVGPAGQGALVQKVINAAYTAFHDGLRDALFLSAGLVLAAGVLALVTLRSESGHTE